MTGDLKRTLVAILPSVSDLCMRLETPIFWALTKQLGFVPGRPEERA